MTCARAKMYVKRDLTLSYSNNYNVEINIARCVKIKLCSLLREE